MSNAVSPIDETRRREFERQWIEQGHAQIEDHLPERGDPAFSATLIELVCIDMEMRSRLGEPPSVSDYVRAYDFEGEERMRLKEEAAYLARRRIQRGSRIGRYVLEEVRGQGAFAAVWRARDPDLGRVVALKRLRPALATDEEARERFRREARSAARLRHPAIVTVHEVGEDVSGPFLVSDFIPGPTLGDALKKRAYTPDEAAELVTRLADALDYAHQFGIVHRDVKPSNVLLDEAGRPLLTDFGLARLGEADATLTRQGQLLGTPAYMSPEQARGDVDAIDRRSDVYSLGVVLYELLCGRPPFQGETATLFYAVVHKDVPRPRKLRREIPADLETICLKAISREPDRRYPTADALADDLRRYLARQPIEARQAGVLGRVALWARRNPAIAASLVVIAVVVGIAFQRVLTERTRFEDAHRQSQANLYRSLVRQAEAQLALPRGAGREAAWTSVQDATRVETAERDIVELRNLALRYLTAEGPHFREAGRWRSEEKITRLALSPDGTKLAEVGPSGTYLRDAATGSVLRHIAKPARAVSFAPNGATIAVARDRFVHMLDATTLAERASFPCTAPPEAIAFDHAGARVACVSRDGPAEVFALTTDGARRALELPHAGHDVAFGAFDTLTLACVDGGIRQVDLATAEIRWTQHFEEPVRQVVSAGQRVAAFSWERLRFTIFDAQGGGQRHPEGLHEASLRTVAFGPGGYVLTASSDGVVAAYDKQLARTTEQRVAGAIHLAAVGGGRILALDRDGERTLWQMTVPRGRASFSAEHRARFLPGQLRLFDGRRILDCENGLRAVSPTAHADSAVWGVAVDPAGRRLARSTHNGRIELLDATTLERVHLLLPKGPLAWTTAFSPDGRVLASGSGNDVLLFDTESGEMLHRLQGHERFVSGLAFRGDELISASQDWTLRTWSWRSGRALGVLARRTRVYDLHVEGDTVYAACRDGCLRIWEPAHTDPHVVRVGAEPLWAVGPGPGGLIATGSQAGEIHLLAPDSWAPVAELRASPRVRSIAIGPTGRYLAASVYVADGAVWDVAYLRRELDVLGLDWD
ncbi:MAG: serine/threonine-protein kinase [Planctomycetota bacterium]|nr:serine/threonine-protein kinase [Planctomycetota bacterium]